MLLTNASSGRQIPWVEKYRPQSLQDLLSHEHIIQTINKFVSGGMLPNLLLHGPPGTGKTSTIIALAKQLYGRQYSKMVLQLNASDERGIAVVRDQIKNFVSTATLGMNQNAVKLVILDEADMMTNIAQFALRRTIKQPYRLLVIEKYYKHARFCLISNYVSKIIPALQSRCTRFKFKQIPPQDAYQRLEHICLQEGLNITPKAIEVLMKLCKGDMRRIINLLQSSAMNASGALITDQLLYDLTGSPSPHVFEQILKRLLNGRLQDTADWVQNTLKTLGMALESLIPQLYQAVLAIEMNQKQRAFLIQSLGNAQYRLTIGCSDQIVAASLVGAFIQIRK